MKKLFPLFIGLCLMLSASASHEVGNYISYENLGNNQYRFTITQIRDCRPPNLGGGNPGALLSDDPIFVSIFKGDGTFFRFDSIRADIPGGEIISGVDLDAPCLSTKPANCLNKLTFTFTPTLPPNSNGYYIVSERCCLVSGLDNVLNSSSSGLSTITFLDNTLSNSSAEFKKAVPQLLCLSKTKTLDFSANDSDGDSLSYALCNIYYGANQTNPKPIVLNGPPNIPIQFAPGYSAQNPMNLTNPNDFYLDPLTGLLTINPNLQGKFIMGVCCTEWRNGVAIQENIRTAVIQTINCNGSLNVTASLDQITPFDCPVKVNAEGAFTYKWSLRGLNNPNQNTIYFDNDSIQNPSILFNQNATIRSGRFVLSVLGSDITNTCFGKDSLELTITEDADFFIPNAFSPNGDDKNDKLTIFAPGYDFEFIRIYNRWGNKVFESNSLNNKWDGTFNGQDAAPDAYYWVARYRDKAKTRFTKKGTVIIMR